MRIIGFCEKFGMMECDAPSDASSSEAYRDVAKRIEGIEYCFFVLCLVLYIFIKGVENIGSEVKDARLSGYISLREEIATLLRRSQIRCFFKRGRYS